MAFWENSNEFCIHYKNDFILCPLSINRYPCLVSLNCPWETIQQDWGRDPIICLQDTIWALPQGISPREEMIHLSHPLPSLNQCVKPYCTMILENQGNHIVAERIRYFCSQSFLLYQKRSHMFRIFNLKNITPF